MSANDREIFQYRDKLDDTDQAGNQSMRSEPFHREGFLGPKGQQHGSDITSHLNHAFTQAPG